MQVAKINRTQNFGINCNTKVLADVFTAKNFIPHEERVKAAIILPQIGSNCVELLKARFFAKGHKSLCKTKFKIKTPSYSAKIKRSFVINSKNKSQYSDLLFSNVKNAEKNFIDKFMKKSALKGELNKAKEEFLICFPNQAEYTNELAKTYSPIDKAFQYANQNSRKSTILSFLKTIFSKN